VPSSGDLDPQLIGLHRFLGIPDKPATTQKNISIHCAIFFQNSQKLTDEQTD